MTKEVSLLPYSPQEHRNFLHGWLSNEELMHGWGMLPFKNKEIDPWAQDPTRVILMVKDAKTKRIIGFVNFYEWDLKKAVASRGTLIDPKHQNQGFGKAAIMASNNYAFDTMGLEQIKLYIEGDNQRSRHITEKLGYIFDGYNPEKDRYYYHMGRK